MLSRGESNKIDTNYQEIRATKLETLGCHDVPLLKNSIQRMEKNIIKSPIEWSKFWTLVRFCQTYYYRDWTKTHLMLHILSGGLLYGDSGSNANKSIQNVSFVLIGVAYL